MSRALAALVLAAIFAALAWTGMQLVDVASGVDDAVTGVGAGMLVIGGAGAVLAIATTVAAAQHALSRRRR